MKTLKNLVLILLGNLLLAFDVAFFVVPTGLISGGVTGLSLAASRAFPLPLEVCIWGFTILFFLLGLAFLGKTFALSTLFSSVAYPLFFSVFNSIAAARPPLTGDIVLNTAFAGLLFGVGYGMFDANNMPILCQFVPSRLRATAYGFMNMVGVAMGALCTTLLGKIHNLGLSFAILGGVTALALILQLTILRPTTDDMQ